MFIYKKPKNLNGAELIAELKNAGLEVKQFTIIMTKHY
jgi:hypothetical protein